MRLFNRNYQQTTHSYLHSLERFFDNRLLSAPSSTRNRDATTKTGQYRDHTRNSGLPIRLSYIRIQTSGVDILTVPRGKELVERVQEYARGCNGLVDVDVRKPEDGYRPMASSYPRPSHTLHWKELEFDPPLQPDCAALLLRKFQEETERGEWDSCGYP
ncbi:hypothetical protein BDV98DRAFT_561059 [Pterulicium gracile]|uniref:Uncharacterized protein n=1 Tax=Pterulicium gracile TaxID=1884261 RepID=A0A5C3QXG1_9AGAR|nr:hypothetical protein BDV98DRAFT_561059 [Pterula gracilis]